MTKLDRLSASEIAGQVALGKRSAEDVMRETLARLQAYDAVQPQVWISKGDPETLLAQSRAIDARVAAGEKLPLAGVPYAVKDNIDVEGFETTAG